MDQILKAITDHVKTAHDLWDNFVNKILCLVSSAAIFSNFIREQLEKNLSNLKTVTQTIWNKSFLC